MSDTTTTKVFLRGLQIAPRKVRVVIDQIRGKPVQEALDALQFITKLGAGPVRKLLDSAIANARFNHGMDVDALYIKTATVDQADMHSGQRQLQLGEGCFRCLAFQRFRFFDDGANPIHLAAFAARSADACHHIATALR